MMRCVTGRSRLVALLSLMIASQGLADSFDPAFRFEDLDLEQCRAWRDDRWEKPDERTLKVILGFPVEVRDRRLQRWVGPAATENEKEQKAAKPVFYFCLAFKSPVAIGTALSPSRMFWHLKADASYPPQPSRAEDWAEAAAWPNQSGMRSFVFPPGVQTRAVLCSLSMDWRRHPPVIYEWRFFKGRLLNLCPLGHANASEEYTPPPPHLGPRPPKREVKVLTTGRGPAWENTGRDRDGFTRRPPIDKMNPVWVMLSWRKPQTIAGLLPIGECGGLELSYFKGPDTIPPKAGTRREWHRLPHKAGHSGVLRFEPVATRGLKITITKGGKQDNVARLHGMHAYADLGERPLPPFGKKEEQPSPLLIRYKMPHDGLATMVIDDANGRRVRNLFARHHRTAGPHEQEWDGKDLDGKYVLPGTYTWRLITSKQIELHYQFTVYPNVKDNPGWQVGHHGSGGWLADHTPPAAVCTHGDRVWLGAPCAESGVSFIECDLNGRKLTGWHSFAAWTGPRYLATDGKTVFIANPKENVDQIWGYDVAARSVHGVLMQEATETRRTGIRGMAARDGKLYLSIRAKSSWVVKPFGSPSVDIENCYPRYRPPRKPRKPHEVVPNPRRDMLRLFRLEGTPPGQSVGLTYLETEQEPGKRHHIVLALKKPQAIGSVVYPVPQDLEKKKQRFYLSVLKPDGKYPPDPNDKSQWNVLKDHGKTEWDIVAMPPSMVTRAFRLTWERVSGDPLADVEEDFEEAGEGEGLDLGGMGLEDGKKKSGPKWRGRLEGMTFLRRRYRNLLHAATVRVSSGEYRENGEWYAAPQNPISTLEPGIFLMEWREAAKVRGLAIKEVDGQKTEIDVFTGPPDAAIKLDGTEHWKQVATYRQARRNFYVPDDNHNSRARYLEGLVDFGEIYETRAVRLRVVEPFQPVQGRPWGVRDDRGGTSIDPKRCRVYGVAPLEFLGEEAPVDPRQTERVVAYDLQKKEYSIEVAVESPGDIALGPKGELFAISAGKVVKVNLAAEDNVSAHTTVIDDLKWPTALTVGSDSRIYVFDGERERQVIRVYDPQGQFLKSIGTAGGRKAGAWDVTRFRNVSAMAVDRDGNLWVVEFAAQPKRISKWSAEGEFIAEFLGPTQYGGGGVLDPYDKTRLYYHALEFEIDWDTGHSRLKNLTWTGRSPAGELPIVYQGRKYMVTRDCFGRQGAGVVYLYDDDHLKLAGAVGRADAFACLQEPEVLKDLGGISLTKYWFTWSDRDGDGAVQAKEVSLKPVGEENRTNFGLFDCNLGITAGTTYFGIKEILPNGAPVWEEQPYPKMGKLTGFGTQFYRLPDGNFFHLGGQNAVLTAEGEILWKYRTAGPGGHALMHAPPYTPDQVCAELANIAHPATMGAAAEGELGAFQVHHSNPCSWNIWTHDGFLAGHLFRDQRHHGTPGWRMTKHHRGLRLDNHHAGQEHFQGYFCRTHDGKFYMVAGHNHASVIEVKGLDTFRRLSGPVAVGKELLQQLKDWEIEQGSRDVFARAPVYDLYRFKTAPRIDGGDRDWSAMPAAPLSAADPDHGPPATLKMGYDDRNLYLYFDVRDGPLKNSGRDWRALFKTGASVDLQLSVNPDAPGDRQAPAEGDRRLLITYINQNEPVGVLYLPVAPDAPKVRRYEVVSPVFRVVFDDVRRIRNLEVAHNGERHYSLEAAVPLDELGFRPEFGQRYRFDWGILTTDDYGNACTGRLYWANKATGILADAPSEAILMPHLWGHLRVNEYPRKGPVDLHSLSTLEGAADDGKDMIDIEKEFEE